MAEMSEIQFCNISVDQVTWSVTPVNDKPVRFDRGSKEYGSVSVPFAKRYLIKVGDILQAASSPSVLAVYTGAEIVICNPA